jgi:hypothetical protein
MAYCGFVFSFVMLQIQIVLCACQAPKPSSGPHKSRECLPLILIIRNRLKYALTYREVISILMQRHVLVDGKVRTDKTYPAGFMGMRKCFFLGYGNLTFLIYSRLICSYVVYLHMSFPFQRLVRTTGFSMTPRAASAFTLLGMRMQRWAPAEAIM